MRRLLPLFVALLAGTAMAAPAKKNPNDKGSFKQCVGSKCHRVAVFQGHNAAKSTYRTEPLEKPTGHIVIRAENLGEEIDVNIYKPDGTFDEAALAKLDTLF